jgi:hypothetical protein
MKYLWSCVAFFLVLLPQTVGATIPTDLVPCGDADQAPCQTCHIYALIENVFNWLFGVSAIIVTIIIVVGGVRFATSGTNQQVKRDTRRLITTAIVGFILIGSAWVLVEFLIATLMGSDTDGSIFSSIQCVPQP